MSDSITVDATEYLALNSLAGYAVTCRLSNTPEWFDGLRERLQAVLDAQEGSMECYQQNDMLILRDKP